MLLSSHDAKFVYKKLEYTFKKKSGNPILEKLQSNIDIELDQVEIDLIKKKFEYTFKKSCHPILVQFGL